MRPARLLPLLLLATACFGAPVIAAGCGAGAGDEGLARSQQALSTGVVISAVYGGGGNTGATYQNDYVELFNRGATDVVMNGWSVQYGSAANAFSGMAKLPNATLAAGHYYLVQLATGGTPGAPLPTADYAAMGTEALNLSATNGKVALVSDQTLLSTCGTATSPCTGSTVVDLVGYGTAAAFETAAAVGPTSANANVSAVTRNGNGCQETDDNATDFSVTSPPVARNAATPAVDCSGYDAGPPAETGTTTDSGTATDSATATDSGVATDSATTPDTAVATDSGTTPDDTAVATDSGTTPPPDTGTKVDSGSRVDSGKPTGTVLPVDDPASACSCDAPGRHADAGTRSTLAVTALAGLALAMVGARRRR